MIALVVFLIAAGAVFILIGVWAKKFLKSTANEWISSTCIVKAYNREDYSSRETPLVMFYDNGKQVFASGSSVPARNRPQPGTEVPMEYRRNVFSDGRTTYQVILKIDGDKDRSGMAAGIMTGIGILLAFAGVLIMILSMVL